MATEITIEVTQQHIDAAISEVEQHIAQGKKYSGSRTPLKRAIDEQAGKGRVSFPQQNYKTQYSKGDTVVAYFGFKDVLFLNDGTDFEDEDMFVDKAHAASWGKCSIEKLKSYTPKQVVLVSDNHETFLPSSVKPDLNDAMIDEIHNL